MIDGVDAPHHDGGFRYAGHNRAVRRHLDTQWRIGRRNQRVKAPVGPHVQRHVINQRIDSRGNLGHGGSVEASGSVIFVRQSYADYKPWVVHRVANGGDDLEEEPQTFLE